MRRFTNSPIEDLMQDPPQMAPPALPLPPREHPCYGCGNYMDTPCVGLCTKEMLKFLNRKEENYEASHR